MSRCSVLLVLAGMAVLGLSAPATEPKDLPRPVELACKYGAENKLCRPNIIIWISGCLAHGGFTPQEAECINWCLNQQQYWERPEAIPESEPGYPENLPGYPDDGPGYPGNGDLGYPLYESGDLPWIDPYMRCVSRQAPGAAKKVLKTIRSCNMTPSIKRELGLPL